MTREKQLEKDVVAAYLEYRAAGGEAPMDKAQAYAFYRWVREERPELFARCTLDVTRVYDPWDYFVRLIVPRS